MKEYTVILSPAEQKALSIVAVDPNEWIQNVVHDRCRIAIEEISSQEINRILSEGGTITGTKEDIVLSANIKTAAERESEIELALQK